MNFSISEILLVGVIALLVIKPEQWPPLAKNIGRLLASLRHRLAKIKAEMNEIIEPVVKQDERKF